MSKLKLNEITTSNNEIVNLTAGIGEDNVSGEHPQVIRILSGNVNLEAGSGVVFGINLSWGTGFVTRGIELSMSGALLREESGFWYKENTAIYSKNWLGPISIEYSIIYRGGLITSGYNPDTYQSGDILPMQEIHDIYTLPEENYEFVDLNNVLF